MPLELRPYAAEDLEPLVRLFTGSVRELARPLYDEAQRAAWAPEEADLHEWSRRLAGCAVVVAEEHGVLAGFIGYGHDGHVALLYTASHAARKGVASELYARVESEWLTAGVRRAYSEVSLAARPFFERHGFTVIEEEHVERRGVSFLRFRMAKELGASPRK
ncbi:MAG: GNAT family N-acetyltransferase [Labilithrix sp.]|nr:GNAT family N-acetyltransferase [Labilithrix sp.]